MLVCRLICLFVARSLIGWAERDGGEQVERVAHASRSMFNL